MGFLYFLRFKSFAAKTTFYFFFALLTVNHPFSKSQEEVVKKKYREGGRP